MIYRVPSVRPGDALESPKRYRRIVPREGLGGKRW